MNEESRIPFLEAEAAQLKGEVARLRERTTALELAESMRQVIGPHSRPDGAALTDEQMVAIDLLLADVETANFVQRYQEKHALSTPTKQD